MKHIVSLGILFLLIACSPKKEGNMLVNGNIKGLKKGTLYLQKMKDTLLVSVDSVSLLGKETFSLTDNVESPVMYYLTFDTNITEKRIMFFGEKGTITITDNLDKFGINPKIEGSKNQLIWQEYNTMRKKFQFKQLELFEADFKAQKDKDQKTSDSLRTASEKLLKRQYLYTTNFALTKNNSEAAPYIALTELVNANVKLLDTVYVSLTKDVKNSTYGKKLQKFISAIKENEKKN